MPITIFQKLQNDLNKNIDRQYQKNCCAFFKEPVKILGVKTPIVRKIAKKHFKNLNKKSKPEIFNLCEQLLRSGYNEKITVALAWSFYLKKDFTKSDFKIFSFWLKKYISNWSSCDDFCCHSLGYLILKYQDLLLDLQKLANSKNRWERRASAVALIYPIRHDKKFLPNIFKTAQILLQDNDDLVQKAYGWMLKEASNNYPQEVLKFINQNKSKMPRTALRYAIEKYPTKIRKQILQNS